MFTDYRIIFLLFIPIIMNAIFFYRNYMQPRQSRRYRYSSDGDSRDFNWWEAIISFALFVGIMAAMWYWGRDMRINNYNEQIGGFITKMYTEDGSYERSYDCNCSTDADGRQHCSTCYETIYYRDYIVENNTGDWWKGNKWSQRVTKGCSTCDTAVPQYYAEAYIGKPVSLDHGYPNYIAAMNESLYRNTYKGLVSGLQDICPATPDYRVSQDSVVKAMTLGFTQNDLISAQINSWNFYRNDPSFSPSAYTVSDNMQLSELPLYMDTSFGYLGSKVQGDTHVYVVNSSNTAYADMCLAKWKNGAKNSIYVFIFGESNGIVYKPTDVYVAVGVDGTTKNSALNFENESERSNYYMKYDIRNELMTYFNNGGGLDRQSVLGIIFRNVNDKFVRQEMSNFKDLKSYVFPTNGFIIIMGVVLLIVDFLVHLLFANNNS